MVSYQLSTLSSKFSLFYYSLFNLLAQYTIFAQPFLHFLMAKMLWHPPTKWQYNFVLVTKNSTEKIVITFLLLFYHTIWHKLSIFMDSMLFQLFMFWKIMNNYLFVVNQSKLTYCDYDYDFNLKKKMGNTFKIAKPTRFSWMHSSHNEQN